MWKTGSLASRFPHIHIPVPQHFHRYFHKISTSPRDLRSGFLFYGSDGFSFSDPSRKTVFQALDRWVGDMGNLYTITSSLYHF